MTTTAIKSIIVLFPLAHDEYGEGTGADESDQAEAEPHIEKLTAPGHGRHQRGDGHAHAGEHVQCNHPIDQCAGDDHPPERHS